jgi:oleate hydratase
MRLISRSVGPCGKVDVTPQDIVIATLGPMISNSTLGSNDSPPPPTSPKLSGSWALWQTLAKKRKDVFFLRRRRRIPRLGP